MADQPVQPASRRWAIRHMQIVAGLVLDYAPIVDGNRAFGAPMEVNAAWREARARVLGRQQGEWAEYNPGGQLGASALLRELVEGMQRAAEGHPEVARVLALADHSPHSNWSLAKWAVSDGRQWLAGGDARPLVTEEVRAQRRAARERWARGPTEPSPIHAADRRRGSGRQP